MATQGTEIIQLQTKLQTASKDTQEKQRLSNEITTLRLEHKKRELKWAEQSRLEHAKGREEQTAIRLSSESEVKRHQKESLAKDRQIEEMQKTIADMVGA